MTVTPTVGSLVVGALVVAMIWFAGGPSLQTQADNSETYPSAVQAVVRDAANGGVHQGEAAPLVSGTSDSSAPEPSFNLAVHTAFVGFDFSILPPQVYVAIVLIIIGIIGFVNDVFLRL